MARIFKEMKSNYNVLVDLDKLENPNCGLGQYSINLSKGLKQFKKSHQNLTYMLPTDKAPLYSSEVDWVDPNWTYKYFGLLGKKVDLWHCTQQDPRQMPFGKKTPMIFSIMDLNFLEEIKDQKKIEKLLKRLQKRVDRSVAITTISQYTLDVVNEYLDIGDRPTKVIHLAKGMADNSSSTKPNLSLEDKKFLFSVGVVDHKKNFHTLVEMLAYLPEYSLVISGFDGTSYAEQIRKRVIELSLEERVFLTGIISDEEKNWLLDNCEAFVFPSLLEGFGIPPVEAMSKGKPVFISNRCSLPEVVGDMGYVWSSFEPESMASVFRQGLEHFRSIENRGQQIKEWESRYTWQRTCESYLDFYDLIWDKVKK